MLIHELDHLQSIDAAQTVKGGVGDNTLFLSLLGDQLSLSQSETLLFADTIAPPSQVTLNLQGASFVSTSAVTQTVNGVTQTTVTVSTQPPSSIPSYSCWLRMRRFDPFL